MDALQREIVGLLSWHLASHPGAGVDGNAPYQGYNPWDTNKVLLPQTRPNPNIRAAGNRTRALGLEVRQPRRPQQI